MLFSYSKSHFPVGFVWMWPYLCFRRSSKMRLVFLRYPFSCESPHPTNTWFFYPWWTALGPVLYPVSYTVWCREEMLSSKPGWPGCAVAEQQSISHSPTAAPAPCPRGVWRLFVPEQPGTLSYWARGDLSVLLDKQVVLSRRGLSVLASLSLPRQGCVGGLVTSTSKSSSL